MKYSRFIACAAIASVASAHTTIWNISVDGVDQGVGNTDGGYIRFPPNNSPVKDLTSTDMTCNVNNVPNARTVDVPAGSTVTLNWFHDSNTAQDDIIAASHVGPVMAYMALTASNGVGPVWVKVAEDGLTGTEWAVTKLIANRGRFDVVIPTSLAPGEYLLRGEIIALHEADAAYNVNPARGAQFYMGCVQINVTGGGSTPLPPGVSIPGAYSYSDAGVVYNVYGTTGPYNIPGPLPWTGDGTSSSYPTAPGNQTAQPNPAPPSYPVNPARPATTDPVRTACRPRTRPPAAAPPAGGNGTSTGGGSGGGSGGGGGGGSGGGGGGGSSGGGGAGGGAVARYGQCGGQTYTGSTTCAEGTTCTAQNPYYSQCV